ncbi:hypothetical protein ACIBL6_40775 [Streptomyces sp. NPDC050400]|uniref:hypothetical protein n=1 Tax=Streptomyces sp. NPDC050400 TaxID=3365610 RepID=UPI00379BCA76
MSEEVWGTLPARVCEETDQHVLSDALLPAVLVLVRHGMPLHDAQLAVHARYERLGDRVARRPEPPLDIETLAVRAAEASGQVVEIAAAWDGDTVHDWFVDLVAVTRDPPGRAPLTTITWSAAERRLGGDRGRRHPAAVLAERLGGELAARIGVPFRFDHPDDPGGDLPAVQPPKTR